MEEVIKINTFVIMETISTQVDTKLCDTCNNIKSITEFYSRENGHKRRYFNSCKRCVIERQRNDRKSGKIKSGTKEYNRVQNLKSNYNLTTKEYDKLYSDQGGKCAICGTPQTELKKNLCVDHDHRTGKNRGLLCVLCNQGLGSFKDNQSNLENALYYLILHK